MAKRQSNGGRGVRRSNPEVAAYMGGQIRAAMERRGWMRDDQKHDVRRLAKAVGTNRYQTAQWWIDGKVQPDPHYSRLIAKVLDMTLEELMGAATGREPDSEAWHAFVASPGPQPPTAAERQALAAMLWPNGPPDVAAYKMALAAMRSTS